MVALLTDLVCLWFFHYRMELRLLWLRSVYKYDTITILLYKLEFGCYLRSLVPTIESASCFYGAHLLYYYYSSIRIWVPIRMLDQTGPGILTEPADLYSDRRTLRSLPRDAAICSLYSCRAAYLTTASSFTSHKLGLNQIVHVCICRTFYFLQIFEEGGEYLAR